MKRLLCWLPRFNWLKVVAPVAAEAVHRGWEITYFCPCPPLGGQKEDAWTRLAEVQAQGSGQASVVRGQYELRRMVGFLKPTAFVHLSIRPMGGLTIEDVAWIRGQGIVTVALPHLHEELFHGLEFPDALPPWQICTTLSYAAAAFVSMEKRFIPVGYPTVDRWNDLSSGACRKKWGLPMSRRIILLGTPAMPDRLPWPLKHAVKSRFRHMTARLGRRWGIEHLHGWPEILEQIAAFAGRHGAYTVAISRPKHPRLRIPCDRLIEAEMPMYPYGVLELLRAADCYIGQASAIALEAAVLRVPQVHILAWPHELVEHPLYVNYRKAYYLEFGGLWNSGELSRPMETYTADGWEKFASWAQRGWFPEAYHDHIAHSRSMALARVLDWYDREGHGASGRVMDLMEGACGS